MNILKPPQKIKNVKIQVFQVLKNVFADRVFEAPDDYKMEKMEICFFCLF
jgi:hypothetical protein